MHDGHGYVNEYDREQVVRIVISVSFMLNGKMKDVNVKIDTIWNDTNV